MARPPTTRPHLIQIRISDAEKKAIKELADRLTIAPATAARILLRDAIAQNFHKQPQKKIA